MLTTEGFSKQEVSLLMLTKAQLAFNAGNTEAALRLLTSESFDLLDLNQAMQIEGSLLLGDTYLATNRFYAQRENAYSFIICLTNQRNRQTPTPFLRSSKFANAYFDGLREEIGIQ